MSYTNEEYEKVILAMYRLRTPVEGDLYSRVCEAAFGRVTPEGRNKVKEIILVEQYTFGFPGRFTEWWIHDGYDERPRCENCGEEVTEEDQQHGNVAEVVNSNDLERKHKLIHYECRIEGDELA